MKPPVKYLLFGGVAGLVLGVLLAGGDGRSGSTERGRPSPAGASSAEDTIPATGEERGRELSQQYCQACHLYPEPELLDRFTWSMETLPRMAFWVGLVKLHPEVDPGTVPVEGVKLFPEEPIMPLEDWKAICNYYLSAAPSAPLGIGRPHVSMGLDGFEVEIPRYERKPLNSMVKIVPGGGALLVGNGQSNTLDLVNLEGTILGSLGFASPPVDVAWTGDGMLVTLIGSLPPVDDFSGEIAYVPSPSGNPMAGGSKVVIEALQRPTTATIADLDGDGIDDLVVSQFGNYIGKFGWFRRDRDGGLEERVLLEQPGAVKAAVDDFDGDGKPDILVMMAQSREGIWLFRNQGGGSFEAVPVTSRHPAWGYASFEVVDFDGDGDLDLLTVNGDNGDYSDYPQPPRKYHGIRILLNDGSGHFEEAFFFPLHGAYKAVARDFDGDGDLDIAAVSYYADYVNRREEGFVYLENRGDFRFHPATFVEALSGKWMTMDAGDIDGDGDIDLVLVSHIEGPGAVPERLMDEWAERGSSILILRNRLR